jgi:hypothetical protein
MRDPKRIDRVLELLAQYWHAAPDLRLGQIVGNFTPRRGREYIHGEHGEHRTRVGDAPGDSYFVEDTIIEGALKDAIAGLDFKPLPPRHPSPCISHKTGTCVWLRDGTKVTLRRYEESPGRAWLEVEEQAVVHLAGDDK